VGSGMIESASEECIQLRSKADRQYALYIHNIGLRFCWPSSAKLLLSAEHCSHDFGDL
jgi:hypothetical protein